jgi:DNA-binding CsgD family transcriptional regulator
VSGLDAETQLTALTRLAELGVEGISTSELLSELVLYVLSDVDARFAALGQLDMHSFVSLIGTYGIDPRSLSAVDKTSLWTPGPLTDAIRLDQPIAFTQAEGRQRYPQWFDLGITGDAGIALPVKCRGAGVGALFLTLNAPDDVLADWSFWSAVAAMCLPHLNQHPQAGITELHRESSSETAFLDERQLTVLRYLAQHKTNAQIAHCMGYGKSTIGHLTMEIYKALNVKTRTAAVHAAGRRGLLVLPAMTSKIYDADDQRKEVRQA